MYATNETELVGGIDMVVNETEVFGVPVGASDTVGR